MNPTSNSLSNRKVLQGEYFVYSRRLYQNFANKFWSKMTPGFDFRSPICTGNDRFKDYQGILIKWKSQITPDSRVIHD